MIGTTDLLHPSPAPHFKTFQAFLFPKTEIPFGCLAKKLNKTKLGSGCVKMHVITHFLFLTTKECSFFTALNTRTLLPTAKRRHAIEEIWRFLGGKCYGYPVLGCSKVDRYRRFRICRVLFHILVNACNSYNSGTKRIRISEDTNALDEFYTNISLGTKCLYWDTQWYSSFFPGYSSDPDSSLQGPCR